MLKVRSLHILVRRFSGQIVNRFEEMKIVPEVVTRAPRQVCQVIYPSGVEVNLGNILTPTEVKDMPKVAWCAKEPEFFTLCMTDPDAPSRDNPVFREWHHWLVVNIPANCVVKGEMLSHYIGSGPPEGTGFHRYIFLVYRQKKKQCFEETRLGNKSADGRGKFSIRKFAAKYDLGSPVAGNFYLAEYDSYVPKLYKQLGAG